MDIHLESLVSVLDFFGVSMLEEWEAPFFTFGQEIEASGPRGIATSHISLSEM